MQVTITKEEIAFFRKKAEEKIAAEKWSGRNKDVKTNNFFQAWVTEEAFKKVLAQKHLWFRHRGLYVGDAEGAGKDFEVKIGDKIKSIGLRSISQDCFLKFKTVPYPNDRFEEEKEKIADFIVVAHFDGEKVYLLGYLPKELFLKSLESSEIKYSQINQEKFRVVPLSLFLPLDDPSSAAPSFGSFFGPLFPA